MAEATQITGSYAAESTRLQEAIAEKMDAEDYDACDALQGELDALNAKHETAAKLTGTSAAEEGVPPAAVASAPAPAPAESGGMLGGFDFSATAAAPAPAESGGMLGGFDFSAPAPAADSSVPNGDAAPSTDTLGKVEATALLNRIKELEDELQEKMESEDYDRCEQINAEVEKLKEREAEAIALTSRDDDGE